MRATATYSILLAIIAGSATAQTDFSASTFSEELKKTFRSSKRNISEYWSFEWEGYDGWYNNPAHPDWGGAGI